MEPVLRFVADYQWYIYGLLGLVVLFYLRRAIVARRESVRSIFALEQEQARVQYGRSVLLAAVFLLIGGAVFGVANYVLPDLNRPLDPTPATSGPLAAPTLTPTSAPPTITPTATATVVRLTRPAPPPSPTSGAVPTANATAAVRPPPCPNPNVRLTAPGMGQVVRGNVPVRGTANVANFQYYKIEVAPGADPQDHEWGVVGQLHYGPVEGGVLETFNSAAYAPGVYTLRLVVVDQTGNYPEPCRVTITVQR